MAGEQVSGGRKAQAVGDAGESYAEGQFKMALHLGILAHYEHNQPRAKFIGGRLMYDKPGVADYTGVLDRGARTLAVEVKSTEEARFYRDNLKWGVKPKQQAHLTAVARAGGLAFLLLEFRRPSVDGPRVLPVYQRFAVPWLEAPWETVRTAVSVAPERLGQWLIEPGTCFLSRWHLAGARSWNWSPEPKRVYPTE